MKDFKTINGFKLPKKKRNPSAKQLSGYIARSNVFVKYSEDDNQYAEMLSQMEVNEALTSLYDSPELNTYRSKIETLNPSITKLGENLIDDYNYKYLSIDKLYGKKLINGHENNINDCYYDKPKICLIRLEQLLTQTDLPTFYIFEFLKPNFCDNFEKNIDDGKNIVDWIKKITKFEPVKMRRLKEYLDEYFQYVFDRPKNIYKINKLVLPIDCYNKLNDEMFAGYFTKPSSTVTLEIMENNSLQSVTNVESNESLMSWFRAIFKNDSNKIKKINDYRLKIENPSEQIKNIEEKLINECKINNDHKRQCLIDLEQLFIRYSLSTSTILDYTQKKLVINEEMNSWIIDITGSKAKRIEALINYLDSYLKYIINIQEDSKKTE